MVIINLEKEDVQVESHDNLVEKFMTSAIISQPIISTCIITIGTWVCILYIYTTYNVYIMVY